MTNKPGNCNSCNHQKSEFFDANGYETTYMGKKNPELDGFMLIKASASTVLGNWYGKCAIGFTEVLVKFYQDNGHKTWKENEVITMECYQRQEHLVILDKCIDAAQKLLDHLKETNKEK